MLTATYICCARQLSAHIPRHSRQRFRHTPEVEFTEPVFLIDGTWRKTPYAAFPEITVHGWEYIDLAEPTEPATPATEPFDVEASIQETLETGPPPKPEKPIEISLPLFASIYLRADSDGKHAA
jgi:hypothetical protein